MATTDKNTLKAWFMRGLKPLASQFSAWLDSYWHKDEKIPISSIDNLQQTLNSKLGAEGLENLIANLQQASIKPFGNGDLDENFNLSIVLPFDSDAPAITVYDNNGLRWVEVNNTVKLIDNRHLIIGFGAAIEGQWKYRIDK